MSTQTKPSPIEEFEARAIAKLKERDFRITMPRTLVIRAIAEAVHPASPCDLHARILEQKSHIDVVSVYRILGTLVECGLAIELRGGRYLPVLTEGDDLGIHIYRNGVHCAIKFSDDVQKVIRETLAEAHRNFRFLVICDDGPHETVKHG